MNYTALIIGFIYGFASVKGQFCMNSGFSNVTRRKDTTKLKSFVTAILVQLTVLPFAFYLLYIFDDSLPFVVLPGFYLIGTIVGGFLFGVAMHFAGGCGAGVFYKLGEKNTGAVFTVLGFAAQSGYQLNQATLWPSDTIEFDVIIIPVTIAATVLGYLFRRPDNKPGTAEWGWKKTGLTIGIAGSLGWLSAVLSGQPYGMAIIPAVTEIAGGSFSWVVLFVAAVPAGAYFAGREKNRGKKLAMPEPKAAVRRTLGGFGLGISGSLAAGCTVGHGLTFVPLLGFGSLVAILAIFAGSNFMGYLTRN